jgi:hypothetical protein
MGAGKDCCFSFGDLHLTDSFFSDTTREFFEIMSYSSLRAFDFRFEDMLTPASIPTQVSILLMPT